MIRTIRLYGNLGKKYGKTHKLHVYSVSEAIRLLSANFPDFKQHIIDSSNTIAGYEVWDGNYNLGGDEKEGFVKVGNGDIKIIPRVTGAGNTVKLIVGAVLIAVAYWFGGPAAGQAMTTMWSGVMAAGVSLMLSGVIGLMTKTSSGSSISSDEDNTQSYLFSGTLNTTKQGNPVFIAYGTHLLGSQVISASLTTTDVPV